MNRKFEPLKTNDAINTAAWLNFTASNSAGLVLMHWSETGSRYRDKDTPAVVPV